MSTKSSRIGLYGGSFDPIHRGHVEPVLEARRALDLDQVVYLPTAKPPHKDRQMTSAARRFAMVELALLEIDGLVTSTFEMDGAQASYTIDTIEHFRRQLPEAELFLIIGEDSYRQLPSWRRWRELVELVELVVLSRPDDQQIGEAQSALAEIDSDVPSDIGSNIGSEIGGQRVHRLATQVVDAASRDLRRRLAAGEAPPELAPPVLHYIRKYRLYGT